MRYQHNEKLVTKETRYPAVEYSLLLEQKKKGDKSLLTKKTELILVYQATVNNPWMQVSPCSSKVEDLFSNIDLLDSNATPPESYNLKFESNFEEGGAMIAATRVRQERRQELERRQKRLVPRPRAQLIGATKPAKIFNAGFVSSCWWFDIV